MANVKGEVKGLFGRKREGCRNTSAAGQQVAFCAALKVVGPWTPESRVSLVYGKGKIAAI